MELNSDKIKNVIENILKVTTFCGGILYFTGLVISAFYYSKFNISSVDLISPIYILTGAQFFAFFFLASVFTEIALPIINKEGWNNFTTYFLYWLSFGLAYFAITQGGGQSTLYSLILFIGFSLAILIFTVYYGRIIKTFEGRKRVVGTIIFFVITAYWTIQTYALYVYPNVYSSWGGAKSHKISLIIKHSANDKGLEHIISFKDSFNSESKEYTLIKETSEDYYIKLDTSNNLMQIPKKETDGVILH